MREPTLNPHYRKEPDGTMRLVGHRASFGGTRRTYPVHEPTARQMFASDLSAWHKHGGVVGPTITKFVKLAMEYAHREFPNSHPHGEAGNWKYALGWLQRVAEPTMPVGSIRAAHLAELRELMISEGKSRNYINNTLGRIKRALGAMHEIDLVPDAVMTSVAKVKGVRARRMGTQERPRVKPVPNEHIDAIRDELPPRIWRLLQVLRVTAKLRIGELLLMRMDDVDRSDVVWTYEVAQHKTAHVIGEKTVYIGPQAQLQLAPLFTQAMDRQRIPAWIWPGKGDQSRPVNVRSVRDLVHGACVKADVPTWHPHQLRHNAGTATLDRMVNGLLNQVRHVTGHESISSVSVYAELDEFQREWALRHG